MVTGIVTTACGAVLAGMILLAAVTLALQVRAIWRNRQAARQFAQDMDRYIATLRALIQSTDQQRIAHLRRTAEAYGIHLPPDDDAPKGA